MKRLYSVCILTTQQMRDIQLERILNDNFVEDDYIHEGEFIYIFENDNQISQRLTTNSKVYKTLNGAKKFKQRAKTHPSYKFRYPIMDDQGRWVRDYTNNSNYQIVVVDITDKWNILIDGVIERKTEEFNREIRKWELKKST